MAKRESGRWVRRSGFLGLAGLLAWIAAGLPAARGQGVNRAASKFHPDSSYNAEFLLRSASSHERDQQWAEVVEIYQRVIAQFGDTLAPVPKDDPAANPGGESRLFVDARQYCQRRLAALPPEARAVYRTRVDPQAERWYRQGVKDRDRALLRRVVEEAFCSSFGDDALERLGDLAFQDGRFAEALAHYRRLVPDRPGEVSGLVHPDPSINPARVAAKVLLCRAALGEDPPGPEDLKAFAATYPGAAGALAGREGPLVESVGQALAADHLPVPPQADGRWPTFAGAAARTKVAPGTIDVGSLQWRIKLKAPAPVGPENHMMRRRIEPPSAEQLLVYHPIVLGDQVVLSDENRMVAYQLNAHPDGSPEGSDEGIFIWDQKLSQQPPATGRPGSPPRFTLTASGDRIFARLGPAGGRGGTISTLVAVRNNREIEGKLIWKKGSNEVALPRKADVAGRIAAFEGSPVADARNVYIALTESGTMTSTYVACLDAETGAQRWVRYIGEFAGAGLDMNFNPPSTGGVGERLLSLEGPTVYYQTNMGALAALDAESGQIRWLATYPQEQPGGLDSGVERDLNPAIVHDGLAIIAPDDNRSIYAFDAATGRLAWKCDRDLPRVVHLLGVAKGHLFATGDHVWTIDVKTGKVLRCWPDAEPGYKGYGRGLLAGEHIYWPTKDKVFILDQSTGLRSDRDPILLAPHGVGGGNLAVGDGYLIVARADELVVFCQNSRLIQRHREEIARNPARALPYFRLARVAEATGQDEVALEALAAAAERARPSETFDGQPLADAARGGRHRLLMKLGAKSAADKDWAGAARRFADAAESARTDKDRLAARLHLADAQAEQGDARGAVDTLQALLSDGKVRPLAVDIDPRRTRTVRADLLIADRLGALLEAKGRDLYAGYERKARELLDQGKAEGDPRLLEEVGRTYPVARVAPEALLALGRLHADKGEWPEAARAFMRLLASSPGDALAARALWGLARAYEEQRLLVLARDAYARALARYAAVRLEEYGPDATVGSLAAEHLAREPFATMMMADRAEPSLPVPLARRWDVRLAGAVRPLAAEGVPPSAASGRIFLAQGHTLRPVELGGGDSRWRAALDGEPTWIGYLADRVLVATANRLVALKLASGEVAWRYPAQDPGDARLVINPFAKAGAGDSARDAAAGPLRGFRLVGGRVYCLRGARELVALDGDTGQVDWSYAPAAGQLNHHLWVGPRRVVLQALRPDAGRDAHPAAIVVLEADRGRVREFPQKEEARAWARDPLPIDDDHVAVAVDSHTVVLLDLNTGLAAWTNHDTPILPRRDPPRLLGDTGRLLVLYEGSELVRLDPATGKKLWGPVRLSLDNLSEWPEALALDAERIYCVNGTASEDMTLAAFALSDGALAWRRHLAGPTGGWVLALTDRCVAAYPSPKRSLAGDLHGLPLVFCRRDTGTLVQRLLLPVDVSELAVALAPRGVLVATQAGLWALGDRRAVDGATPPR
jgi:cellulose synthase operon protein C